MTFPLNPQRLSSGNKALKGIFALLLVFATGSAALAQTDIRAVYNFAPNSQVATAVVENWSVDNWGDNYLSAGFGLKAKPVSLGGAWLEYARNFNFWHQVPVLKDFSLQAEFNGRVAAYRALASLRLVQHSGPGIPRHPQGMGREHQLLVGRSQPAGGRQTILLHCGTASAVVCRRAVFRRRQAEYWRRGSPIIQLARVPWIPRVPERRCKTSILTA